MRQRLHWDPIACTGHGLCADLLPERIELDEWGYPVILGDVPPGLAAARAPCGPGLPRPGTAAAASRRGPRWKGVTP